ncbi:BMC domain-containing protein [Clostridium bowmanii]|uniref:BMC domain-containing protein n=1 Tax=Clostridium bowmanii TaxID=132925 RepID=UPI001C0AECE3|nr:BMC domain-containing protein [Clostridium bowmanii]MBU3191164.1 BMC domain-containing protein [Clostridium bowmanii]MCA1075555.1 BMC domain-containing protein [Clostridium bowmanii]
MYKGALGLIEVYGYIGAVEAADTALKAANVNLIGCEIIRGGLVTVKIQGDVSSVIVAVEAAEVAIKKFNISVLVHVIPWPDTSVWDIINKKVKTQDMKETEFESNILDMITRLKKQLQSKKVYELRTLARSLSLDNMTKKQIKFAKKNTLIEELILFYQRRDK